MGTRGKNINLFLMDGRASGRIKATLANWTGLAFKIPRVDLEKCKERDEFQQSGVYFLFGPPEDPEESSKDVVYIGQAGIRKDNLGIFSRLKEHLNNPDKDYWNEVVVLTTSNNSFGPTEISYLEQRFFSLASSVGRYNVKNSNEPNGARPTEEKESELEEFIDYSKIIMGALGYKIFEAILEEESEKDATDKGILYLERMIKRSNEKAKGRARMTREGFVVLKGSKIERTSASYLSESLKKDREKAKVDSRGILQEDILYRSPSAAASFVIGANANGWVEWKNKAGISLKDLES